MSKISSIVFTDLHLHIWKTENPDMSRTNMHFKILYNLLKLSQQLKVPIIFAGDLMQDNYSITNHLLSLLVDFFDDVSRWYKQEFYFIVGNHDQSSSNFIGNRSPNYLVTLQKMYKGRINFIELSHLEPNSIEDIDVYGIPYLTNDTALSEIISEIPVKKNRKNLLVLHTAFEGAIDSNSYEFSSEELPKKNWKTLFKDFELVLCGHIHKYQALSSKVLILGAPIEMRTSDIGTEFGYWELLNGEKIAMKRKALNHIVFNRDKLILDPISDGRGIEYQIDGPDFSITDVVNSYFSDKGVSKRYKNEFLKLISNDKNN